jgi:hypothetical protein
MRIWHSHHHFVVDAGRELFSRAICTFQRRFTQNYTRCSRAAETPWPLPPRQSLQRAPGVAGQRAPQTRRGSVCRWGWDAAMSDDEILEKLLALNLAL